MNTKQLFLLVSAFSIASESVAQTGEEEQNALAYRIEESASLSAGDYTPFWLVSNRHGMAPLEAGNSYLSAGMFYNQNFGQGFRWNVGADLAAVFPRYRKEFAPQVSEAGTGYIAAANPSYKRNALIRQLYAELSYRSLRLTVGSKEEYRSLWDGDLSSGDLVSSVNARPIPEARISMPAFSPVPYTKGRLYIKGDFSIGRSLDNDYLSYFTSESGAFYVKDVLWHTKSLFFRVAGPGKGFPLSLEFGLRHGAQWSGVSTNPRIAEQPGRLSDFVRILLGREGGEGATASDSINVLGNHFGSYDFKLAYEAENWTVKAYHQRYFEDKSGTIFGNGWDGLWGLQLDLQQTPWLQKIVVEILETRNQTGPFHFIHFDHEKHPGVGGGADNYYNNGEYTTGLSYFNRGMGSPLLPSPEYNADGSLGFKNTRVHDWHFGLMGDLSSQARYRLLLTFMNTWGTHYQPFLEKKTGTSALLEIVYRHPRLRGWLFTGSLALDTGTIFGKNAGIGISVAKRGILPIKQKR
jgi:hypothetical protein